VLNNGEGTLNKREKMILHSERNEMTRFHEITVLLDSVVCVLTISLLMLLHLYDK